MTHHLVGMAEIAEMLGVTRQRVAQLIESYDDFPPPEVELTAGRIWSRSAIETWIANHPERRSGRREEGVAKRRRFFGGGHMFQRFTDRAREGIVRAQEEARLLDHNYIGTEHLLLGLMKLEEGVAYEALVSLGVTHQMVQDGVLEMIGRGGEPPTGHIPFTPRAKKILELSLREAMSMGHNYIGTEHVLLALVREKDGVAWKVLAEIGLKPKATREAITAVLTGVGAVPQPDLAERLLELEVRIQKLEQEGDALEDEKGDEG